MRSISSAELMADHVIVPGNHERIVHIAVRTKFKKRVFVDELVKPPRAQPEAHDDLVRMQRLSRPRNHAALDERNQAVGDNLAVDAEILAIVQIAQNRVRNPANADLERVAVFNQVGDVPGDRVLGFAGLSADWNSTSGCELSTKASISLTCR